MQKQLGNNASRMGSGNEDERLAVLGELVASGLPLVWQQLVEAVDRIAHDARVHIGEIFVTVDAHGLCTVDQAHGDGAGFSTALAAGEEPVLPADGQRADCVFGRVIVDAKPAVSDIAHQCLFLAKRVGQRLAQRLGGQSAGKHFVHTLEEGIQQRGGFKLSGCQSLFFRGILDSPFDIVKQADVPEHFAALQGSGAFCLIELSPGMRPAADLDDARVIVENVVVPAVGIGLQKSFKVFKDPCGPLLAPVAAEIKKAQRRPHARKIDPQPPLLGFSPSGNLQVNRAIIGVDHRAGKHFLLERLVKPLACEDRLNRPSIQRGGCDFQPLAHEDLPLAVDRQVIGPFVNGHQGEHAVVGLAFLDRRIGHGHAHNPRIRLPVGRDIDRTDVALDVPAAGPPGNLLADFIAQLDQGAALGIDLQFLGKIQQDVLALKALGNLVASVGITLTLLGSSVRLRKAIQSKRHSRISSRIWSQQ